MVHHLNTVFFRLFSHLSDIGKRFFKTLVTGTAVCIEVGDGNIPASECLVIREAFVRVGKHLVKSYVSRNGDKSQLVEPTLYRLCVNAVKSGKFNAVVAEFLDFCKSCAEILFRVVTH